MDQRHRVERLVERGSTGRGRAGAALPRVQVAHRAGCSRRLLLVLHGHRVAQQQRMAGVARAFAAAPHSGLSDAALKPVEEGGALGACANYVGNATLAEMRGAAVGFEQRLDEALQKAAC